ncbi:MFS transporter [Jatrophihabitans telluris]|uniref:MFS transporter n=1 Tax=Jatrophihabitans telluris TaxID=2038343 RepID=A0ABY4QVM2_9ACTN|nr:MFS transporter [Jatrophihabitans telluris]UQX87488.1 MFS transporter [Jatrophihabitans telluris]
MLNKYKAAYARPGTSAFSAAGFVFRFSIAVYPIALVLIISGRTGEYGFAGVLSGCYVIGGALGNPLAGTLVDRLGQHRVLPPYLLAHLASTIVLAGLIAGHAALWTLPVPAAAMGFTFLNVGALVRARWSFFWPGDAPQRSTGYSIESTLDELIFVLGPLAGTILATQTDPLVTLGFALVMVAIGSVWLTRQRSSEPPVVTRIAGQRRAFALRSKGMLLISLVMVSVGGTFGSVEVVMVAFCGQHGQRSSSGWVVACFALGSGLAGLLYGARHWRSPLLVRFVLAASVFALLPLLTFVPDRVPELALCIALVGLGTAPTLIAAFGLVDAIVPSEALTEGLTWIGTGLSVGYGVGAAVGGGFADVHGARVAFWIPVGCAMSAGVLAWCLFARLDGSLRATSAQPAVPGVPMAAGGQMIDNRPL